MVFHLLIYFSCAVESDVVCSSMYRSKKISSNGGRHMAPRVQIDPGQIIGRLPAIVRDPAHDLGRRVGRVADPVACCDLGRAQCGCEFEMAVEGRTLKNLNRWERHFGRWLLLSSPLSIVTFDTIKKKNVVAKYSPTSN